MPDTTTDLIVWIDLEMTGLEPSRHRILEIAAIITDASLEVVAESPDIVVYQPEEVLRGMNEWSRKQHALSGLTDRVRGSTVGEREAEARILEVIAAHCPKGAAPLGGNSVHLDRYFLQEQMPALEAHLHYVNVDVSTVKELARRWYPDALSRAPRKTDAHRALDDLRDSIAELRYYRAEIFLPSPQT